MEWHASGNDGIGWLDFYAADDKVPSDWDGPAPDEVTPLFTAAQMHAYAEENRAALLYNRACPALGRIMTDEEADKKQAWAGMDGATAFLLIQRHAEDWEETGAMMEAWRRAAVAAERERCAKVCEAAAEEDMTGYGIADDCANRIRAA